MGVLVTCKNEEDPIKNEGARVVTTLFIDFSHAQGQLTPKSVMESYQNSISSKLLWLVFLPAKMKKVHLKMKVLEWSQHFSHNKSMGIFSNPSKLLWLTLLPARMKKIHWKMRVLEWSQCFSHYKSMGIFPKAQGQLTHKSFFGYCPISNPSEILWVSLLPARIKKNKSKMKELEWSQGFPHYNPMGAICCHENQSSDLIRPKTSCS